MSDPAPSFNDLESATEWGGTPPLRTMTPEEAGKAPQGTRFKSTDGRELQVPYKVSNSQEAARLPEGSEFIAPTGQKFKVPETDPLGPLAQILYGMAPDEYRRRQVLERVYGADAITKTPAGDLRIRVPGQENLLNPDKWGPERLIGDVAPTAGAVAGSLGAGMLGLPSGPGALGAALVGAGVGSGFGQALNDGILAMVGIHPESAWAEAAGVGEAGALGAAGEGAGRVVGRVVPPVYRGAKAVVRALREDPLGSVMNALPAAARDILETDVAAARRARTALKGDPERGIPSVRTAPSRVHHAFPTGRFIAEVADPKFRESPLRTGWEAFYESRSKDVLGDLGIVREDKLFGEPRVGLPKAEMGTTLQASLSAKMEQSSRALDESLADHEAVLKAQGDTASLLHAQSVENLNKTAANFREDAEAIIDRGFREIDHQTDLALKAVQAGEHPADLFRVAGERINRLEAGFMAAAERQYAHGYRIAGPTPLNTIPIAQRAQDILETVPEGFDSQLPGVLQQLRKIGVAGGEEPAAPVTLEQAHRLRTLLRARIDWSKPNADAVDHSRKEAEAAVNQWLHDPSQPPLVKAGVDQMDKADAFYRKVAPKFDQKVISTIISKMKSGFQSDAPKLARMLFEPDETLQRENARKLLGPKLWQAVHAADVQNVIESSKILGTERIDAKTLASLAQRRFSQGMWQDSDFGPGVSRLIRQTENFSLKPGSIPIHAMPGDSVDTLIRRANTYLQEAERAAKLDPIGAIKKELAEVAKQRAAVPATTQAEFDPLARRIGVDVTTPKPTVLAIDAADNVLNSQDLIVAAARTFGADSPEFNFIRDLKVQQIFEGGNVAKVYSLDPEVRQLLFPGRTLDKTIEIADTMKFLMGEGGADIGASIAAMGRVLNPLGELRHINHTLATELGRIPIVGPAIGRVLLGAYYKAVTNFITGPVFLDFLLRGVPENPVERTAVKKAFDAMVSPERKALRRRQSARFGTVGAGAAASQANQPEDRRSRRAGGGYIPPRRAGDAALEAVR